MFSKIWTKTSTKNYSEQIKCLQAALQECEAVVIGAGSGLSTAAGYTYTGSGFKSILQILRRNIAFVTCTLVAFIRFLRRKSFGVIGAVIFLSTVIWMHRSLFMKSFLRLVADKDYFVITN